MVWGLDWAYKSKFVQVAKSHSSHPKMCIFYLVSSCLCFRKLILVTEIHCWSEIVKYKLLLTDAYLNGKIDWFIKLFLTMAFRNNNKRNVSGKGPLSYICYLLLNWSNILCWKKVMNHFCCSVCPVTFLQICHLPKSPSHLA